MDWPVGKGEWAILIYYQCVVGFHQVFLKVSERWYGCLPTALTIPHSRLDSLPRGNFGRHRIASYAIAQMRVLAFSMLAFLMLALSPASALKVLVTGAGGRTGRLVFEQLQQDASMSPVGLVRSRKAEKALRKVGAGDDDIVRGDVMDTDVLAGAMAGCDGVVLCTSAVPQIKPLSIASPPGFTQWPTTCAVRPTPANYRLSVAGLRRTLLPSRARA